MAHFAQLHFKKVFERAKSNRGIHDVCKCKCNPTLFSFPNIHIENASQEHFNKHFLWILFGFQSDLLALNGTKPLDKQEKAFASIEKQAKLEFPQLTKSNEREFFERMLQADGTNVFLYLHGNTGSRAAAHRVELYKLLREMGFHILALDYRSYGDSTSRTMSEAGVVRDAIAVYKYITNITKTPVFVWGHSLGTGILAAMMASLEQSNIRPPKLAIMESPFSNIRDEVREHPFSRLFRHLPWFDYTIAEPMYANHLRFESDKNIAKFRQPVMILHAQDDLVVPFKLGYKVSGLSDDTDTVIQYRFEARIVWLIPTCLNSNFPFSIGVRFSCFVRHWTLETSHGVRLNFIASKHPVSMDISIYSRPPNCQRSLMSSSKHIKMNCSNCVLHYFLFDICSIVIIIIVRALYLL